jgi:hypothetical protein
VGRGRGGTSHPGSSKASSSSTLERPLVLLPLGKRLDFRRPFASENRSTERGFKTFNRKEFQDRKGFQDLLPLGKRLDFRAPFAFGTVLD